MYHRISIIACLVFFSLQGGDCIALCRPKVCVPSVALPSVALSMPVMGVPCAEPVSNCGPEPIPLPIIQAPPITVPTIEGPIIPLPSPPIPCPKTIAHRCVCTKTVVKPQLIQRCITVPTVQRYLKRTYTPVVENITYKSRPRGCQCTCGGRGGPGCTCGGSRLPVPGVCSCGVRPASVPVCAPPPPVPLALPFSRIC